MRFPVVVEAAERGDEWVVSIIFTSISEIHLLRTPDLGGPFSTASSWEEYILPPSFVTRTSRKGSLSSFSSSIVTGSWGVVG